MIRKQEKSYRAAVNLLTFLRGHFNLKVEISDLQKGATLNAAFNSDVTKSSS